MGEQNIQQVIITVSSAVMNLRGQSTPSPSCNTEIKSSQQQFSSIRDEISTCFRISRSRCERNTAQESQPNGRATFLQ